MLSRIDDQLPVGSASRFLASSTGVNPDIVVDDLPHATFKGEMHSVFKGPADRY